MNTSTPEHSQETNPIHKIMYTACRFQYCRCFNEWLMSVDELWASKNARKFVPTNDWIQSAPAVWCRASATWTAKQPPHRNTPGEHRQYDLIFIPQVMHGAWGYLDLAWTMRSAANFRHAGRCWMTWLDSVHRRFAFLDNKGSSFFTYGLFINSIPKERRNWSMVLSACGCLLTRNMLPSVTASRNENTLLGQCLVAQVSSRLIGWCLRLLWSST